MAQLTEDDVIPTPISRRSGLRAGWAVLLLAGCTVGPDYQPPGVELPPAWSRAAAAGDPAPAVAPEAIELTHWWQSFGDPTLDSLVDLAVAANPEVAVATARVREARAAEVVSGAGRFPAIGSEASYVHERMSRAGLMGGFLPDPEFDLYQAGFDAAWEIDLFGGRRRAVEAAHAVVEQADESVRDVQVELGAEVARSYVALRGAERRLVIADRNLEGQRSSLELTEERFRAGLTGELDVTQSRSLLASTEAQRPRLEAERDRAVHRLSVLAGRPPEALRELLAGHGDIPGTAAAGTLASRVPMGLPSDLLRRRPDVRRAERGVAAASARVGVATADLFPKLSLTGSVGLESVSASDFFDAASRAYSIGPAIRWPIFQGGRIRAQVEAADAREEAALALYRETVLVALEDVENALSSFARERERHGRLVEAVAASRRSVELARDLYQNGLGSFLQVLDAERTLYAAEDSLVLSDGAVAIDLVALFKALGGGWDPAAPPESARPELSDRTGSATDPAPPPG
ncbi:MAG: efflux transporter outer membrane subunit [Deltaproteobacteria bacterium]|nr:efflux transporter outer membrane subunit [Deltaproteobacteria bacterium]